MSDEKYIMTIATIMGGWQYNHGAGFLVSDLQKKNKVVITGRFHDNDLPYESMYTVLSEVVKLRDFLNTLIEADKYEHYICEDCAWDIRNTNDTHEFKSILEKLISRIEKLESNHSEHHTAYRGQFHEISSIEEKLEKLVSRIEKFEKSVVNHEYCLEVDNKCFVRHAERIEKLEELDICLTKDIPFLNKRIDAISKDYQAQNLRRCEELRQLEHKINILINGSDFAFKLSRKEILERIKKLEQKESA